MKHYVLFYDNRETGVSGYMELHYIGDPFRWVFDILEPSVNPTTTLTLVEI